MGGLRVDGEIPLLSSFLHLSDCEGGGRPASRAGAYLLVPSAGINVSTRPLSETAPGGEFDWGGTSVKW